MEKLSLKINQLKLMVDLFIYNRINSVIECVFDGKQSMKRVQGWFC